MASVTIRSNNLDNIVASDLNAKWTARGDRILRYYIDLRHTKLNLHKEVSAPEIFILQSKMDAILAAWDEKYETFQKRQNILSGQAAADDLSTDAMIKLDRLPRILAHTLKVDDRVNWESLKDKSSYDYPKVFDVPKPRSIPAATPTFNAPKIGIFDLILGRKAKILEQANAAFNEAKVAWQTAEARRQEKLVADTAEWQRLEDAFWQEHVVKKSAFEADQAASHAEVDRLAKEVAQGSEDAVIEHASLVLEKSNYDGLFEKSYLIQYQANTKLMKVAYDLPSMANLPNVKLVKFIKATGELRETLITERETRANFESVCYQVCLRTLHELFEADEHGNLQSILFNGFVNFLDPTSGLEQRTCLLSVLVDRESFSPINLARVEPKACFKSLKGVSAASLASLAAIAPVMEMDTEDRRFIEAREVGSGIDQGTNLASISWEDFEHLVREVFEREFAARGGEVKVTRASSDGGVDAVAFDPDPITGGKIVIQAKRYTRTVGVAAVRELFGTVTNEGASRGILVTTADYGPDAYAFANGKPLTLMNGANLLHMMQRHGQRAHINLADARAAAAKASV